MRILYGVVGEGMGHATRSRVILEHLATQHELHVVASGRAHDYLQTRFARAAQVHRIWGLTMAYHDNAVQLFRTLLDILAGALAGMPKNSTEYLRVVRDFAPHVWYDHRLPESLEAISSGVNHRLPILSIDNMQVINRCRHPQEILAGPRARLRAQPRAVDAGQDPRGPSRYLITRLLSKRRSRSRRHRAGPAHPCARRSSPPALEVGPHFYGSLQTASGDSAETLPPRCFQGDGAPATSTAPGETRPPRRTMGR